MRVGSPSPRQSCIVLSLGYARPCPTSNAISACANSWLALMDFSSNGNLIEARANVNDRQGADLFRRNTSGSAFEALHPSRKPGGTVEGSTVAWEILHAQDKPALATERAEIGVAQHALATQLQGRTSHINSHLQIPQNFLGGRLSPRTPDLTVSYSLV